MTAGRTVCILGNTPICWSKRQDRQARILWVGRMKYEISPGKSDRNEAAPAECKLARNVTPQDAFNP